MTRVRLGLLLVLAVLASACSAPPQQQQWGQGYESAQGYQEPAHGYFYYWMLYHGTMGLYEPTVVYHVYVPPYGYAPNYRPWGYARPYSGAYATPRSTAPVTAYTPARAAGGFSPPPAVPARQAGGFTPKPAPPPPQTRSSGGFSSFKSSPSPSRSSGGFSRKK